MKTVSQCNDVVDLIIGLEAEELKVNTMEELERVKDLCKKLSMSQGFYGRLLRDLEEIDEHYLPIIL